MAPADRVNLLADSWALVEAGRAEPSSYLDLLEEIGNDSTRAVWEQVIGTLTRLDWLARNRPERPALQAYARAKLRPLFDRLGWDARGAEDNDSALLRTRLISVLGSLGDEQILAEAKRRFAAFQQDPAALPPALRGAVTHLVGLTADRATYDTLLALARKTMSTSERVRYYSAAASARDAALAQASLDLTLTNELPTTLVGNIIGAVASSGEQGELAWAFVQKNFETLANKQGPSFRNQFVSGFLTNFSDAARAEELAQFAPVHATSGGRIIAERSQEAILIAAELKARALPPIAAWIRQRTNGGRG
jgi:aminopeptidase N